MRVNESIDPSGILLPKSYDVENVPNHFGLSQYDSDSVQGRRIDGPGVDHRVADEDVPPRRTAQRDPGRDHVQTLGVVALHVVMLLRGWLPVTFQKSNQP